MKEEIRKEILLKREALSPNEVHPLSEAIIEKLITTEIYKKSKNIFTYINFQNEVKTTKLIDSTVDKNKNAYLPLCNTIIKEIVTCKFDSWQSLEFNKFGILEPKSSNIKIANRKYLELAIVPGIVFDKQGNRIGYGAGYYDKFFASLKRDIYKIGICYSFQLVDSIIPSPHDIPMNCIITEKEVRIVKAFT